MMRRGLMFLCLLFGGTQLLLQAVQSSPVDAEVRAHLEAKVMSSMSMKDLEKMVENDERIRNAPKRKFIIVPKNKDDPDAEAIVIEKKPKKYIPAEPKFQEPSEIEDRSFRRPIIESRYGFGGVSEFDGSIRRSSFEPQFHFSGFESRADKIEPSWFQFSDLESSASVPVQKFYESLVASVLGPQGSGTLAQDPLAILEAVASEDVPSYRPRFDYDSYSRDSTETKLKGKPYWKDAPERRDEKVDENGCRTVVKKIMDPDDEKKTNNGKAKSVVITKECEYPNIDGPDAKIPEIRPIFRPDTSRLDSEAAGFGSFEEEPDTHKSSRPEELEFKKPEKRDPLAPDYIDRMLESHFKSFPSFGNPLTSFKGYQDRFKLRTPEAFKNIKPKIGVQSYEYSHPESGFDEEEHRAPAPEPKPDSPRVIEHHYHYDYPEGSARKAEPESYVADNKYIKKDSKSSEPKDPKMTKKSFAYYRKDNPKEDPNDHQYAEEYAQGNYRSFSSDYDSERDGPKKS